MIHVNTGTHVDVYVEACVGGHWAWSSIYLFFLTSIYLVRGEEDHPTVPTWRRSKDTLQDSVLSAYHVNANEFQGAAISAPPWHWARRQPALIGLTCMGARDSNSSLSGTDFPYLPLSQSLRWFQKP